MHATYNKKSMISIKSTSYTTITISITVYGQLVNNRVNLYNKKRSFIPLLESDKIRERMLWASRYWSATNILFNKWINGEQGETKLQYNDETHKKRKKKGRKFHGSSPQLECQATFQKNKKTKQNWMVV